MSAVILESVSKRYGPTYALREVSLAVPRGVLVLLLGPNGSGKSTLLDLVCGFRRASSGRIRVLGHDPWHSRGKLHRRLSCLVDRLTLKPWMSCLEAAEKLIKTGIAVEKRLHNYASLLGVREYWHRSYSTYSAGMRKKCLLLLTLSTNAELVAVDEPFENLDAASITIVRNIFSELRERGVTMIIASHITAGLENLATHVALLINGTLIDYGEVYDVAARHGSLQVIINGIDAVRYASLIAKGKQYCIRGRELVIEAESIDEAQVIAERAKELLPGAEARIDVNLAALYGKVTQAK